MEQHPKYVLEYDGGGGIAKYVLYEYIELEKNLARREYARFGQVDIALDVMWRLNDQKAFPIAFTTKMVDNIHDLSGN